MFRRFNFKQKAKNPFIFFFALILGVSLAVVLSAASATTVGTNITVTGYLSTSGTTASSSISYALGVGTTTPGTTFSVGGSGYFTSGLGAGIATTTAGAIENIGNALFGDAAGDLVMFNAATLVHNNAGTTTIPASNASAWNFATSSASISLLRLDTSNTRVGISTTSPGATLGVAGTIYSSGSITTTGGLGSGIATTTAGAFEITGNALFGDAAGDLVMFNSASLVHNNKGTTTILASSADSWNFATSSANIPLLKLDTSNTRVGISTTSPGATLAVAGTVYSSGSITTTGGLGSGISTTTAGAFEITGNALFGDAQGDLTMFNSGSLVFNNVSTTTIVAANANSFNIATSSANIPFLKFDTSNYRIGISTTSPGATFSVAGNAYITGNLSVGTNGTNVATIQHAWIDCGPITGAYTIAATTTGFLRCNGNIPQGHAADDKVWLTASSTAGAVSTQGWYDYTGKASSTAAGTIQVLIFNNSGTTLTNANLGTSSWQLLLIK